MKDDLKTRYEQVVNEYVDTFKKKQNVLYLDIIDTIGGNYLINDHIYLYFDTIKTDIDLDAPVGLYADWYWEMTDRESKVNYENWVKYPELRISK